jgi:hypothetical protein
VPSQQVLVDLKAEEVSNVNITPGLILEPGMLRT